jgi:hypothetical protein
MKINSKLQHLVKLTWKRKIETSLGFTREKNLSLTCIICLLETQQLTIEEKIMILIFVINKKILICRQTSKIFQMTHVNRI